MDNPFLQPLRQLLLQHPLQRRSQHQLMLELVAQGGLDPAYGRDPLSLFQAHFLVMNALYQLQHELWQARQWRLAISPLDIGLQPFGGCAGGFPGGAGDARLAAYYLDWSHFRGADRASVEQLLQAFWRRYLRPAGRAEALQALGLTDPVTEREIQRRYRQRVMACHPDRGGSTDAMVALNRAMETLRQSRG